MGSANISFREIGTICIWNWVLAFRVGNDVTPVAFIQENFLCLLFFTFLHSTLVNELLNVNILT